MTTTMAPAPHEVIAAEYMEHKGLDARPFSVEKLDGQDCWYFYYELEDGRLELEVYYNKRESEWETTVTGFSSR